MVDYTFLKVLIFCDSVVGKQTFIKKYCSSSFGHNYKSTIGVDLFTTKIKLRQGDTASLTFWDIAEQSYFNRLMTRYYEDANAGIIIYDLTDGNSLNKIPEWIQKIRKYSGDIPLLLVGNKSDLKELREGSKEKLEKLKKRYDLSSSIEISLTTGENVEQMFMKLTELILNEEINNENIRLIFPNEERRFGFFDQNIGIKLQSHSWHDPYIFLTFIRKKPDKSWKKPPSGEERVLKFSLEEMVMILDVLRGESDSWSTVHKFKGERTIIKFQWDKKDARKLWVYINKEYNKSPDIGNYHIPYKYISVFRMLLDHILQQKIAYGNKPKIMN
ncbi:MAG: Rab family GTPase [Promethearchaeota archaeon]